MRIVLIGGGGHASDVLGAIEALRIQGQSLNVIGLVADSDIDMTRFLGRDIEQIGTIDDLPKLGATHYIACVGYSKGRKQVAERAGKLTPFTVIHPRAWVPHTVIVGAGSVILAGVCISPKASFGVHTYISHGSLVGHDAFVGSYATVMPGASVSGDTNLGEGCLIGANAVVLEKLSVGDWATVGAGAVVTKNVPAGVTVIGSPAREKGSTDDLVRRFGLTIEQSSGEAVPEWAISGDGFPTVYDVDLDTAVLRYVAAIKKGRPR